MSWRFLPNAICIVRIMLVGPLVWLIVAGRHAEALAVLIVAGGAAVFEIVRSGSVP